MFQVQVRRIYGQLKQAAIPYVMYILLLDFRYMINCSHTSGSRICAYLYHSKSPPSILVPHSSHLLCSHMIPVTYHSHMSFGYTMPSGM